MLFDRKIFVIVPAYNEERLIASTLRSIPSFVDRIWVIDDASCDGTAQVAKCVNDTRIEVVSHAANLGVGAAIVTGYKKALSNPGHPHDALAVMAGDGQMAPDDLNRLVQPVVQGKADYAKGDRFSSDEIFRMPLERRIGGKIFSKLTSLAIGQTISDSQCGYTAISRKACTHLELDLLWPRYGYPNDLLGQLAARQMKVVHAPVRPIYAGESSGLTISHLPRIAWLIARAGWRCRKQRHSLLELESVGCGGATEVDQQLLENQERGSARTFEIAIGSGKREEPAL